VERAAKPAVERPQEPAGDTPAGRTWPLIAAPSRAPARAAAYLGTVGWGLLFALAVLLAIASVVVTAVGVTLAV
jgi:hypothetical protein